ncbi:MAG: c-type cytochrome [Gemmatimonadetes bacterium]|nr:c-type cytochrome [Gemmatimonadota bacterium]
MSEQDRDTHQHHPDYWKIYVALVILLAISVVGTFSGILWITFIMAFGVALVKATLVAENFMHLKWEKVIAKWVLGIALILMVLFFAGVSPDIMKDRGLQWVNNADLAATARGIPDEEEPEKGAPASAPDSTKAAAATQTAAAAPAAAPFSPETTFKTVCAACHGPEGEGNGPGAAALNPKPANFTDPAFWTDKTDSVLEKAIRQGGASVGKSSAMPAWGSILTEAQAKQMVAYLHTLKGK